MAHIHEELVIIKLSKLVREHDEGCPCELPEGFEANIEAVVGELLGDPSVVVEVLHDKH